MKAIIRKVSFVAFVVAENCAKIYFFAIKNSTPRLTVDRSQFPFCRNAAFLSYSYSFGHRGALI
jgi:hypothetical protein